LYYHKCFSQALRTNGFQVFLHIDVCRIRALQKVRLLRFNIGSRKEHKRGFWNRSYKTYSKSTVAGAQLCTVLGSTFAWTPSCVQLWMWPKQIGKKQLSNYSKKDSCSSRALFVITSSRLGATWFGWIAVALIPVCFSLSWRSSPNMHRSLHVALRCVEGDWLQWPYVHAPCQH
jgi:hypothetical protein